MVDELGASDVPLIDSIQPEVPRTFFPSLMEWASDNFEQITISDNTNGTLTIFTVPDNFTLFITSYYVQGHLTAAAADVFSLFIHDAVATSRLIRIRLITNGSTDSIALSPSMPLKAQSGQNIILQSSSGNGFCSGGFTGFLLPKKISIR